MKRFISTILAAATLFAASPASASWTTGTEVGSVVSVITFSAPDDKLNRSMCEALAARLGTACTPDVDDLRGLPNSVTMSYRGVHVATFAAMVDGRADGRAAAVLCQSYIRGRSGATCTSH